MDSETQTDLFDAEPHEEIVRGQQMIDRIRELQQSGFRVTELKCESMNGVYVIRYRKDW